jgi:hypothetical protein
MQALEPIYKPISTNLFEQNEEREREIFLAAEEGNRKSSLRNLASP